MAMRLAKLSFNDSGMANFVEKSYDRISSGYDNTWTSHMRDKTEALLNRLPLEKGQKALDLACGTGFATGLLYKKTQNRVTGVDSSAGMLSQARRNAPECEFVQSDILDYLKSQKDNSFDIVTCCWAIGYSRPFAVMKQIKRVLKKDGCVAIIDNSLFSLKEILYCSFLAFLEQPEKLEHLMKFRFLTSSRHLALYLRLLSMKTVWSDNGQKSFFVQTGDDAIAKLRATGAAAGFEYAANEKNSELIFRRFAEILEQKYKTSQGIEIIHRYFEGIAQKR